MLVFLSAHKDFQIVFLTEQVKKTENSLCMEFKNQYADEDEKRINMNVI